MGKNSIREYINRAIDAYKGFFTPDLEAYYCMFPGNFLNVYMIMLFKATVLCALKVF